jgi:hypothetical protein
MLVIAMETGFPPGGRARWAGRRHDDDWADARSGASQAELFDAVFGALHDGEQVALGLDCPLSMPSSPDHSPAVTATAGRPGLAELEHLLDELGMWRPWTRVSTSLARWRANTSILLWQADSAPALSGVTASAAVDSFFRQLRAPSAHVPDEDPRTMVNLAAAAARRAGLFVDPSELSRPAVTITVTDR